MVISRNQQLVYRITLAKYANSLVSPGTEGRWNSKGYFMIYSAGSRALACLENLVHTNSIGLKDNFRVLTISVPNGIKIAEITMQDLPKNWYGPLDRIVTRMIGNNWLTSQTSAILKVPSAIIPGEFNFLLNPAHPEFKRIVIVGTDKFIFDNRLK